MLHFLHPCYQYCCSPPHHWYSIKSTCISLDKWWWMPPDWACIYDTSFLTAILKINWLSLLVCIYNNLKPCTNQKVLQLFVSCQHHRHYLLGLWQKWDTCNEDAQAYFAPLNSARHALPSRQPRTNARKLVYTHWMYKWTQSCAFGSLKKNEQVKLPQAHKTSMQNPYWSHTCITSSCFQRNHE